MKKFIILVTLLSFSSINVKANTEYTEYNLIGYTTEKKEDTDLVKYVKTNLNKFYKYEMTNIAYLEKNRSSSIRPFVDMDDYKIETYYKKNRQFTYPNIHTYLLKAEENYKTGKIAFHNFNTGFVSNKVHEIEIFVNKKKINYTTDQKLWINNDNKNDGKYMNDLTFAVYLDELYPINDIEIYIYYDYNEAFESYFEIEYTTEEKEIIKEKINLEYYIENNKTTMIKTTTPKNFEYFLPSNNLMTITESQNATKCYYFMYQRTLYKYYNLKKTYYITADLEEFEDYIYDKEESIEAYRILQREKVEKPEEITSENEETKESLEPSIVTESQTNEILLEELLQKSKDKTTSLSQNYVKKVSKYPAVVDTNKDRNSGPIIVEETKKETASVKNDSINKITCINKENFILRYFIILIIMYIFTKVIRFIRVKRKNKN